MSPMRVTLGTAIAAALLAALFTSPAAALATTVTAPVTADTTWTAAGNPWVLEANVEVASGVRLSIAPGVQVVGGMHSLLVYGDLDASGTPASPVYLTDTNVIGRGTFVPTSTVETFTVTMRHCDITGGSLQGGGAAMYGRWVLEDSVVVNVDQTMYLWFTRGDTRIERNVFINAGKIGAGTAFGDVYVTNNLFWRPWDGSDAKDAAIESWAAFDGYRVVAERNSFLAPSFISVRVPDWSSSGEVTATSNWWTTTSPSAVDAMIFDRTDTLDSPTVVSYLPLLAGPDAGTPTAGTAGTVLPLVSGVQLSAESTSVRRGQPATLTVTLADARGRAMPYEPVTLQSSPDGATWSDVASATLVSSVGTFSVPASETAAYRAVFAGVPGVYTPAVSAATTVGVSAVSMVRLPGADRYEVALRAALAAHPGWAGVSHVIIACGSDRAMADPLTASGLAGLYDAPLLLVRTDTRTYVPTQTIAALSAIAVARGQKPQVHVIGGPASVTAAQLNTLKAYDLDGSVDRVSGADRYEVAANVASRIRSVRGAATPTWAFVTNGQNPTNFWNALAAAPAAGRMGYPILLTKATIVPPATKTALSRFTTVTIVGLPADTPTATIQSGVAAGTKLERVSGADRYATADAFARLAKKRGWLGAAGNMAVGNRIADSLTGGASMATLGGPLLYSSETTLAPQTGSLLEQERASLDTVYVLGGTASMPTAIWDAIAAKLGIAP